ncbi:MAG TPA: hypothetical protein VF214_06485 [Edaphobacter sp.]
MKHPSDLSEVFKPPRPSQRKEVVCSAGQRLKLQWRSGPKADPPELLEQGQDDAVSVQITLIGGAEKSTRRSELLDVRGQPVEESFSGLPQLTLEASSSWVEGR